MKEKYIEKRVCDYAKSFDIIPYKFTSPARAAVPDRMFITPSGVIFFIEFKMAGKKPGPAQAREITRLLEHNANVHVVDDVDQGKLLIDKYRVN